MGAKGHGAVERLLARQVNSLACEINAKSGQAKDTSVVPAEKQSLRSWGNN